MRLLPVIVAMLLPLMITRREAGILACGILVLPPGSCILRARQRAKCPSLPRLDFRGRNSPIRVVRCRGGAKGAVLLRPGIRAPTSPLLRRHSSICLSRRSQGDKFAGRGRVRRCSQHRRTRSRQQVDGDPLRFSLTASSRASFQHHSICTNVEPRVVKKVLSPAPLRYLFSFNLRRETLLSVFLYLTKKREEEPKL